jgi:hypothetical protein
MMKTLFSFSRILFSFQELKTQELADIYKEAVEMFNKEEYIQCYVYMKEITDVDKNFTKTYYYKARVLLFMRGDSLALMNVNKVNAILSGIYCDCLRLHAMYRDDHTRPHYFHHHLRLA